MSQEGIQIPKGWELKKIGNLTLKITKGIFDISPNYYVNDGVPFLRISNIQNFSLFLDTVKFLTAEKNDEFPATQLNSGDIVMAKMNGPLGGKVAIIPKSIPVCNLSQNLIGIKIDQTKLFPKFLFYFLQSNAVANNLFSQATGTSQKMIRLNIIRELEILLPSLETQKKIVQKLDHMLDQLEEKKKQILELHTAEKLGHFLESNKFSILQLVRTGFYADGNWNDYPKVKISKITKVTSGSTPDRNNQEYWDGDIPWLKSGELLDGEITHSEEHITNKGLNDSSAKLFPKDTVLVALYGQGKTRGKTGRLLIESSTNQAVCGIFPNSNFLSEYVQYWIRSMYLELRKTAVGGAQPNWNTATIKDIEIVLPPLDEQKRIIMKMKIKLHEMNDFKKRIEDIIEQKNTNLKYINHIQSSILDSAFSGKLIN